MWQTLKVCQIGKHKIWKEVTIGLVLGRYTGVVNVSAMELDNLVAAEVWPTQIVTSSITKLNFKSNKLTQWPAWMCERVGNNVQTLSLASNQLSSLPLVFGMLGGLTRLNVAQNHLKSLPASFADLTNLVKLKISNNELNIVPPPIFELPNLVTLAAFGNEFTALPSQIHNLTKMRSLNLNNNQLRTLPPEVRSFGSCNSVFVYPHQDTRTHTKRSVHALKSCCGGLQTPSLHSATESRLQLHESIMSTIESTIFLCDRMSLIHKRACRQLNYRSCCLFVCRPLSPRSFFMNAY